MRTPSVGDLPNRAGNTGRSGNDEGAYKVEFIKDILKLLSKQRRAKYALIFPLKEI